MNIATCIQFTKSFGKIFHGITTSAFLVAVVFLLMMIPFYSQAQTEPEITSRMVIEMNGPIRFYITQPDGSRSGSWRLDSDFSAENISDFSLQPKYQAIVLSNPEPGTYRIEPDYRFDGMTDSELTINYSNPGDELFGGYYGDFILEDGQNPIFEFTINAAGADSGISFSDEFYVPNDPQVFPENNLTRVIWEASEGDNVAAYRIYKKQFNKDFDYSLVGQTTETELMTDIPWGPEILQPGVTSDYTQFVISQIYDDGTESFLSNPAYNNDTDQDGFDDETEIELGTDPNNVDTDGDTLNDFFEINVHNTNPLKADSDDDGFNDPIELSEGTSPLDPNFFPTDGCENPETGDWYVNQDCNLYEDTAASGDIIIGNNSSLGLKERVTLWFNFLQNKILIMVGSNINLQDGASIKQMPQN